MAGAKEGVVFLQEFRQAGFKDAAVLRTFRNARTKNQAVVAVEVLARKYPPAWPSRYGFAPVVHKLPRPFASQKKGFQLGLMDRPTRPFPLNWLLNGVIMALIATDFH